MNRRVGSDRSRRAGEPPTAEELAAADAAALEVARLANLGRLTQRVAHDCNNLLMVVLGHADLVVATAEEASPAAWATIQEDADQICRATRKAGNLMRQLLEFARAGGEPAGEFRADRLLKDMAALLQIAVPKSTTLVLEGPFPPLTLSGAAGEIRQLVTQLVLDAVAAVPDEGGRIVVRLREEGPGDPTVADRAEAGGPPAGRVAILEVEDNGRARREPPARPGGEPGAGFDTVLRIARRQGATVRVDEVPGGGTRCRVAFPLER